MYSERDRAVVELLDKIFDSLGARVAGIIGRFEKIPGIKDEEKLQEEIVNTVLATLTTLQKMLGQLAVAKATIQMALMQDTVSKN